jgi:hypothetical protein
MTGDKKDNSRASDRVRSIATKAHIPTNKVRKNRYRNFQKSL